jgi:hypothetical protein
MSSSISDEDSNPDIDLDIDIDIDIDSLKLDMGCVKYKLKKLKSGSKDIPGIEECGIDFAIPDDVEAFRQEAKDAQDEVHLSRSALPKSASEDD